MSGPSKNDVPFFQNCIGCSGKRHRMRMFFHPEGMVKLNESAGEILSRVDGTKSILCITEELEKKFGVSDLLDDVLSFVELASQQRLVDIRQCE